MSPNFILFLLLLLVTATVGKYVYVQQDMNWLDAQKHCRTTYTDLAPISDEYDRSLLRKLNASNNIYIWIGLIRNTTNREKWLWSGGGDVSKSFWAPNEPNDHGGIEDYAVIKNYSWNDAPVSFSVPFFCYNVHAVREKKTWEEALQYCRKSHNNLASVASETEMMLMWNELRKDSSTQHVWIGLQFLAGDWQWVDGRPYAYEAWGQGGKPGCPALSEGCGALQMMVTNLFQIDGNAIVEDVKVWNARNCDEKLHFLCY